MSTIHVTSWQDAPVSPSEVPWFAEHANLVTLTAFLADQADARSVAYAVEKPWKFEDEFHVARALNEHEFSTGHEVRHAPADLTFYCNGEACGWTVGKCDDCGVVEIGVQITHDLHRGATARVRCSACVPQTQSVS